MQVLYTAVYNKLEPLFNTMNIEDNVHSTVAHIDSYLISCVVILTFQRFDVK